MSLFKDFQFTWPNILKGLGVVIAIVLVAALVISLVSSSVRTMTQPSYDNYEGPYESKSISAMEYGRGGG
ncbi:MAG: hypothetical protein U9Q15_03645 [Patescibacteria group bacterium]|nr:hypothetical protein [Patescibacteria group bacterium]